MSGGERVAVLRAFQRALEREAHVLRDRPALVWPQLFNRLQWLGPPVDAALAVTFLRRTEAGASPWLHLRTPPRESEALVRTFAGHEGSVECCALAEADATLVSAGTDGTVRIWDTATGLLRHTCTGHRGTVHACAVSSTAGIIATAGEDRTVRVWSLATGALRTTLTGHRAAVHGCAMTPAGNILVTVDAEGRAMVWNPATAERRHRFLVDEALYVCAVSPDGRRIAAAGKGRTVRVWDLPGGASPGELVAGFDARGCRFTPDGSHLLVAGSKNDVTVLDLASGESRSGFYASTREHHRFYWGVSEHRGPRGMDVSPDGTLLLTAAPDNTLRLWTLADGREHGLLVGHADVIRCAAFGADGRFAASGGEDGTVRLWDLGLLEGQERVAHADPASDCAWSRDGRVLVALWGDRTAALLDPETLQEIRRLGGGNVFSGAVSPDGRRVATTFMGVSINIHEVEIPRIAITLEEEGADPSTAWIHACTFDGSGRLLVSANEDGTLSVWDLEAARKLAALEGHRAAVTSCTVDAAGTLLASSSRDGTVALWDLEALRRRRVLDAQVELTDCALVPDGTTVVAAAKDGSVCAWSTADGRLRWTRTVHAGPAHAAAVSPDGRLVFSAGADKTLAVLDLASGTPQGCVVMPGELSCLAAHPRRPEVVCGDEGGGLYRLVLKGIPYGPITEPPPAHRARAHAGAAAPRPRVDFPPDALTAVQVLAVALPGLAGLLGVGPPLFGDAGATRVLLGALLAAWVLMTRIGTKERPAVPRCDGEVALLTGLAAGTIVLPGLALGPSILAGLGVGIIATVVDLAAGQRREDLLLKIPLGWGLAAAVPAGYTVGRLAAAAAGPDPAAATAAGWAAGLLSGAVVIPLLMVLVAKARERLRGALMARAHRPRAILAAAVLALSLLIGPALAGGLTVAALFLLWSRPSVRWSPAVSPAALAALLLAGFALLSLRR